MNVLHITCSDQLDSASRGAGQLHRALLQEGVESRLLVRQGNSQGNVECVPLQEGGDAALLQNFCFDQNEAEPAASAFHLGNPSSPISGHPAFLDCDLIHLHQVAGAVSPAEIRALAALGKPVVWSLPDAWAFTGGCFAPGICARFTQGCAQCPQLNDDSFHLPSLLFADKAAQLSGMSESAIKVGVHRGMKALAALIRGKP